MIANRLSGIGRKILNNVVTSPVNSELIKFDKSLKTFAVEISDTATISIQTVQGGNVAATLVVTTSGVYNINNGIDLLRARVLANTGTINVWVAY